MQVYSYITANDEHMGFITLTFVRINCRLTQTVHYTILQKEDLVPARGPAVDRCQKCHPEPEIYPVYGNYGKGTSGRSWSTCREHSGV